MRRRLESELKRAYASMLETLQSDNGDTIDFRAAIRATTNYMIESTERNRKSDPSESILRYIG